MYLEHLKSVVATKRGMNLRYRSGDTEESIELSREAADQTLHTLRVATSENVGEGPLTLTVLGHQVLRTHEAYGLLLRTQQLGDVVFSLPLAILTRLITDLVRLESSPSTLRTVASGEMNAKPNARRL